MGDLEIYALQKIINANPGQVSLELGLRHALAGSLQNLALQAQDSPRAHALRPRLIIPQLAPGSEARVVLPLLLRETGPLEVCFTHITARLNGHGLSFPDAQLELLVLPLGTFPVNRLILTCQPVPDLVSGTRRELEFNLRNDSPYRLDAAELRLAGPDFDAQPARLSLGALAAGQSASFRLRVTAATPGDCVLRIELDGLEGQTRISKTFDLGLKVHPSHAPAPAAVTVGDVVMIGADPHIRVGEAGFQAETGERAPLDPPLPGAADRVEEGICPHCGQKVPMSQFCVQCGHVIGRPA